MRHEVNCFVGSIRWIESEQGVIQYGRGVERNRFGCVAPARIVRHFTWDDGGGRLHDRRDVQLGVRPRNLPQSWNRAFHDLAGPPAAPKAQSMGGDSGCCRLRHSDRSASVDLGTRAGDRSACSNSVPNLDAVGTKEAAKQMSGRETDSQFSN